MSDHGRWDQQPDYREFIIHRTEPQPPVPTRAWDWTWAHKESCDDGPDCIAHGQCGSVEECKSEIDNWWFEKVDEENFDLLARVKELEAEVQEQRLERAVYQQAYEADRAALRDLSGKVEEHTDEDERHCNITYALTRARALLDEEGE